MAMQVIGSVDEAKRAADAGFDVVVAQGREAGGHVRGHLSTMTLLPQVLDELSPLPVVAAGGIGDRRGAAAALALGAAGYHFGSPTRDVDGDVEAMALYAGEVVGLVRKIEPAAAIVSELAEAFRPPR